VDNDKNYADRVDRMKAEIQTLTSSVYHSETSLAEMSTIAMTTALHMTAEADLEIVRSMLHEEETRHAETKRAMNDMRDKMVAEHNESVKQWAALHYRLYHDHGRANARIALMYKKADGRIEVTAEEVQAFIAQIKREVNERKSQ
jgi:hypothetical protein